MFKFNQFKFSLVILYHFIISLFGRTLIDLPFRVINYNTNNIQIPIYIMHISYVTGMEDFFIDVTQQRKLAKQIYKKKILLNNWNKNMRLELKDNIETPKWFFFSNKKYDLNFFSTREHILFSFIELCWSTNGKDVI